MCCCKIGLLIYGVLELCAFLCFVVGTPLDQFRSKDQDEFGNTPCLTLWGCKPKCYDPSFKNRVNENFEACPSRAAKFKVAQSFAILTILISLVALIMVALMCSCLAYCSCCVRLVVVVLTVVAIGSGAVTWSMMVVAFHNSQGECPALKKLFFCPGVEDSSANSKYGAGFGLLVVGWVLQVLNMVFIHLPY